MNVSINAKRLRATLPEVVERVRKGTRFTVIYTFLAESTPEGKYRNFVAS